MCAACPTPRLNLSSELRPSWEQHPRYLPHRVRNGYNRRFLFNHLKTKSVFYIGTQSVPRCKHCTLRLYKTNLFMLCKVRVHTKHLNTMWEQCRIFECYTWWYMKKSLDFKMLIYGRYCDVGLVPACTSSHFFEMFIYWLFSHMKAFSWLGKSDLLSPVIHTRV